MRYRGRFAPSPTGPLHLGSLFTALASYLQARACGGEWRVRIDDVDRPRCVAGAADGILRCLEIYGLEWDGPVSYQQPREPVYQAALASLDEEGHIYRCRCSRKDLVCEGGSPVYPGHCLKATVMPHEPHALRIRVPEQVVTVVDELQGRYPQHLAGEVGDFVIKRRDGIYAYHLATVLDDAAEGVTEVMRGIDLLDSTPRQIFLQQCLGLPTPRYAHLPVLVGRDACKLSKQSGASAVETDRPNRVLSRLLSMMGQQPPTDLATNSVRDILAWAVANWDVQRLANRKALTVTSN